MRRFALGSAALVAVLIAGCVAFGYSSNHFETLAPQELSMTVFGAPDDTPGDQKAEVVIKAPDRVTVGDMIVLDLSESLGGGFDYAVEPMPPGLRTFDNGKIIVCGTGNTSVTYTFSVSCALDGDSDIAVHRVAVVGARQPGPPPSPGEDIVNKVKDWATKVNSPTKRDDAMKLAQSFASVAIITEQGTFKAPEELVTATQTSNQDALNGNLEHWIPMLDALMVELKAMAAANKLPNATSHAPVWRDVAQGLKEYAATLD